MLVNRIVKCLDQLKHALGHTAPQAALDQLAVKTLDYVEPRGSGWRVLNTKARMPLEPAAHFGMLVLRLEYEAGTNLSPARVGPVREALRG